jgi:hypothetical protein
MPSPFLFFIIFIFLFFFCQEVVHSSRMSRARPNNNDWEAWVQKGSSNGNATTSLLSTTEEFKAAHDAATTHRQLTGEPASAPPDASVCQRLAYRLANATFFALCFIYVCFAAVESMVVVVRRVRHKKKMIFFIFFFSFFVFRFSFFVFRRCQKWQPMLSFV